MTKRKHPGRSSGLVRPESFPSSEGRRPPRATDRPQAAKSADSRPKGGKRADSRLETANQPGKRPDRRPDPGKYPQTSANTGRDGKPRPAGSRPDPGRRPDRDHVAEAPRAPESPGKSASKAGRGHWLYGQHPVKAALENPRRKILRLLLTEEAVSALGGNLSSFKEMYPNMPIEILSRDMISQLLPPHAVHQGAALLADPLADVALDDVLDELDDEKNAVILLLDQVTDPQNVGAILRSAAAFNVAAVVVPDRHSPPETTALAKAASGAIEIVPLVRVVNLARALEQLKQAGFWTAGLAGEATQTLAAANLSGRIALVLGAEGEGLRRLTRDHCDLLVKLPISPRMESLNVSAAAAVALYELARKA